MERKDLASRKKQQQLPSVDEPTSSSDYAKLDIPVRGHLEPVQLGHARKARGTHDGSGSREIATMPEVPTSQDATMPVSTSGSSERPNAPYDPYENHDLNEESETAPIIPSTSDSAVAELEEEDAEENPTSLIDSEVEARRPASQGGTVKRADSRAEQVSQLKKQLSLPHVQSSTPRTPKSADSQSSRHDGSEAGSDMSAFLLHKRQSLRSTSQQQSH